MNRREKAKFFRSLRGNIKKIYRKTKLKNQDLLPGEQLRKTIKDQRKKDRFIPPDIRLWLMFLDEAIIFWLSIWTYYREEINHRRRPDKNRAACLMTLSGRVFQDLVCVRDLIETGFFVQSNIVARSLIEAIDVMHLINAKPEIADRFVNVKDNDAATTFWHTYCSKNKLHKIVEERWNWFFSGDKAADAFSSMRHNYLDLIGMSVHPSFPASFISFMDAPDGARVDSIFRGAIGRASHMSKFTVHLILIRVFEYGLLWSGPKMSLYKGDIAQKRRRRSGLTEKLIEDGLSVLLSILAFADQAEEKGPSELFPEFKTYWAPRPVSS